MLKSFPPPPKLPPPHVRASPPVFIAADAPIKRPEPGHGWRSGQHIGGVCPRGRLTRVQVDAPRPRVLTGKHQTCERGEQECENRRKVRREDSRGHLLPSRTAQQIWRSGRDMSQHTLVSKHSLAKPSDRWS